MNKVQLTNTDLVVSPICLGTMHYGDQLNSEESGRQLDEFLSCGGNFVDTAHVYGTWVPGLGSSSEEYIGKWFSSSGKRHSVVLSTKGAHPAGAHKEIKRVTPDAINKDLEESLKLLQTDYIDLYFLHRDDPDVPVEDIIDTLEKAVKDGKIRYYAASNWSVERIKEADAYAASIGSHGFAANQLMFSLADITHSGVEDKTLELMDEKTYAFHFKTKMSVLSFTSIAKGYFMKRYEGRKITTPEVYDNESNDELYSFLLPYVERGEYTFTELSFLYELAIKDFPVIPIASFHNNIQLENAVAAWDKTLPSEIMDGIKKIKKFVW